METITPSSTAALEIRDLVKSYGKLTAVDHLSLEVNRGEVFGFLGPNGAGKPRPSA
jgi:ABC-2 type transport system ATP-binding protein